MTRMTHSVAAACLSAAFCVLSPAARAQIAPVPDSFDISGQRAEWDDVQRLTVWHDHVEAVRQNGERLVCDQLNVYFAASPVAQTGKRGATGPGQGPGNVKRLVAEGHVLYVTPTQTVRGEHAVYDSDTDTITVTGQVVIVQGDNVAAGDTATIDLKTSHMSLASNVQGENRPGRVRGVFYNSPPAAPALASAAQPAKP